MKENIVFEKNMLYFKYRETTWISQIMAPVLCGYMFIR